MGIVTIDGKPLAVTVAALPADGTHETGTREFTDSAHWLSDHASLTQIANSPRRR